MATGVEIVASTAEVETEERAGRESSSDSSQNTVRKRGFFKKKDPSDKQSRRPPSKC